jgi:hypothetical protein
MSIQNLGVGKSRLVVGDQQIGGDQLVVEATAHERIVVRGIRGRDEPIEFVMVTEEKTAGISEGAWDARQVHRSARANSARTSRIAPAHQRLIVSSAARTPATIA